MLLILALRWHGLQSLKQRVSFKGEKKLKNLFVNVGAGRYEYIYIYFFFFNLLLRVEKQTWKNKEKTSLTAVLLTLIS